MSLTASMNPPSHTRSLHERVDAAYRALALIHAACLVDEGAYFVGNYGTLINAVSELAREAADGLAPIIHHAPADIENWTPHGDQAV